MRPYLALARAQARAALAYRLSYVLSLFALIFQFFAMLAIWTVLLGSGSTVVGFDLPRMKAYLLVGFVSGLLVSQGADWQMSSRIQDGMIALDLTKPVDYQKARFAEVIGGVWTDILAGLTVCAAVLLVTGPVPAPGTAAALLFGASMLVVV